MAAKTTVSQRVLVANELSQLQNALGASAKAFTSSTDKDETNTFHYLQVMEDGTAFTNLSKVMSMASDANRKLTLSSLDTFVSGVTFPQGFSFYGYFANIKLSAGRILAYSLDTIA